MDEYQSARIEGAKIFRLAIAFIRQYGWDHNSMDILLSVTPGRVWSQPMAVFMYSELESALDSDTLTGFDKKVKDQQEVINLFAQVAKSLELAK